MHLTIISLSNIHKPNINKMKLCYFFGGKLKTGKLTSNFQLVSCLEQLQMLLLLKCKADKHFCLTPFTLRNMEAQEHEHALRSVYRVQSTFLNYSSKSRTCSPISFDTMRVQNRIPWGVPRKKSVLSGDKRKRKKKHALIQDTA